MTEIKKSIVDVPSISAVIFLLICLGLYELADRASISDTEFKAYFSLAFAVLFLVNLIYSLLAGKIAAKGVEICRNEMPNMFMFAAFVYGAFILLGVYGAYHFLSSM